MEHNESETNGNPSIAASKPRRGKWRLVLKVLLWSVAGVVALCVIAGAAITLYLTPKRLASIASDYAERYLDADIKMEKIDFTIWSTFPHFKLQVDSAVIVSHRLRGLSKADRALLPADADTLAYLSSLSGSIEPLKLLQNRIFINSLHVKGLRLNFVALNDSVNNFDILPPSDADRPFIMPRFEARSVTFRDLQPFTYYSAATQASARVHLDGISMNESHRDRYKLLLRGRFWLAVQQVALLQGFPFDFSGNVDVSFRPFCIDMRHYNVALGNLRSQMDLSMKLGDNNSQLTSLRYSVSPFQLMRLFEYLPAGWLPALQGIRSDVTLEATASLTAPYRFSSDSLPCFKIDFKVPDSWLTYSIKGQPDVRVHNIGLRAHLDFNGNNEDASRFRIDRLWLQSEGINADLQGEVHNLFTSPAVTATVNAGITLARLTKLVPALAPYKLRGDVESHVSTSFTLADIMQGRLAQIPLRGTATVANVNADVPEAAMKLRGCTLETKFAHINGRFSAAAEVKGGNVVLDINKQARITAHGLKGKLATTSPVALPTSFNQLPLSAWLQLGSAEYTSAADSTYISAGSVVVDATLEKGNLASSLIMKNSRYSGTRNFAALESLAATLNMNLQQRRPDVHLKAKQGHFVSFAYPEVVHVAALDVAADPDCINLQRLAVRSQRNAFSLSGTVTNYMTFAHPADSLPVMATIDLQADTIDINQIAGALHAGSELKASTGHKKAAAEAPDSTSCAPWLIPQWLKAAVNLHADECTYTNLRLMDLGGAMHVGNGIFRLDSIQTHTDFGSAYAKATYTGTDAHSMGVDVTVALDTIRVVTFFERFHTLLEMMPQMSNLSGYVSASVTSNFHIFPDMYINLPSLQADINAQGRDLQLHQSKFIHRLCRYLLIHTHDDLKIKNMDVHATIHDNQLELYPFLFEMDRYRLSLTGENDFAGNLYYHVGVEHSPVPFPFGVNIVGTFSNPDIRFGRPSFQRDQAMRHMRLVQPHRFNMVTELRWLANKFMEKAAQADRGTIHPALADSAGHPLPDIHSRLLSGASSSHGH